MNLYLGRSRNTLNGIFKKKKKKVSLGTTRGYNYDQMRKRVLSWKVASNFHL